MCTPSTENSFVKGIDALQKTASLASSLFAMMSITVGVHHVWRHRSKVDALYQDAVIIVSNFMLLVDC
jgi:fatty-acid desaturase